MCNLITQNNVHLGLIIDKFFKHPFNLDKIFFLNQKLFEETFGYPSLHPDIKSREVKPKTMYKKKSTTTKINNKTTFACLILCFRYHP